MGEMRVKVQYMCIIEMIPPLPSGDSLSELFILFVESYVLSGVRASEATCPEDVGKLPTKVEKYR